MVSRQVENPNAKFVEKGLAAFHIKLVSQVAFAVAASTACALFAVIVVVTEQPGESYFEILSSYSMTRQNLGLAMTISGLGLLSVVGFITWLIALYSSFRVAGPLYRFSRNLELLIAEGPVKVIGVRRRDYLQAESEQLADTVAALRSFYDDMRGEVENAQTALDENRSDAAMAAIQRIKKLNARVLR